MDIPPFCRERESLRGREKERITLGYHLRVFYIRFSGCPESFSQANFTCPNSVQIGLASSSRRTRRSAAALRLENKQAIADGMALLERSNGYGVRLRCNVATHVQNFAHGRPLNPSDRDGSGLTELATGCIGFRVRCHLPQTNDHRLACVTVNAPVSRLPALGLAAA